MPLNAGNVELDEAGGATGSGLAKDLFDALVPISHVPDPDNPPPEMVQFAPLDASTYAQIKQSRADRLADVAKQSTAIATVFVNYLKANLTLDTSALVATVGTAAHVGKLPVTLTAGTPIDGPASPVTLPITGTVTVA